MGGPGSGRRYGYGARSTTDDYRAVDVRRWAREGMLTPGYSSAWQWTRNDEVVASLRIRAEEDSVIIMYRCRSGEGEVETHAQRVRIVRTQCNLGGSRPWFLCPVGNCERRVAILYKGEKFACRHCHRVAYPSSREDAGNRALRRADEIRSRLGWRAGVVWGHGPKPKWMRWSTFIRLVHEHDGCVRVSTLGAIKRLGL